MNIMTKETCLSYETSCSWIVSHVLHKFQQKHYQALLLETQNALALKKLQDLKKQLDEAEFLRYKYKKNYYYDKKDEKELSDAKKVLEQLRKHIDGNEKEKTMKSLVEIQMELQVDKVRHQLVCDFLKRRIFEEIQEKEKQKNEIKQLYERTKTLQQQLEVQYERHNRAKKLLKKSQKLVEHFQLTSIHTTIELSQMNVTNIQLKSVQNDQKKSLLKTSVKLRQVERQNASLNKKIVLIQRQFRLCYTTKQRLQHQLRKGLRSLLKVQDYLNKSIHQLYLITDQLQLLRVSQRRKQQFKETLTQKLCDKTQKEWKSLQSLKETLLRVKHQTQLDNNRILGENELLIQSNGWLKNETRFLKRQLEEAFDSLSELHHTLNTLKLQLYQQKQLTIHYRIEKGLYAFMEERKARKEKTKSENLCALKSKHVTNTCSSFSSCIKTNDSIHVKFKKKSDAPLKGNTLFKSDTPQKSTHSQKSDTPQKSTHSQKSDTPKKGAHSQESDTPQKSAHSQKSDTPKKGAHSQESDTPQKSTHSQKSDTPKKGAHSQESDTPKKSFKSRESHTPQKSDTPKKGDTPQKSTHSQKSYTPQKSTHSQESDTPQKGAHSQESDTPQKSAKSREGETLLKNDTLQLEKVEPKLIGRLFEHETSSSSKEYKGRRQAIIKKKLSCSSVSAVKQLNFLKRRSRKSLSILPYNIRDNPSKLIQKSSDSSNESAESLDVGS